jgi:hypothetical protein
MKSKFASPWRHQNFPLVFWQWGQLGRVVHLYLSLIINSATFISNLKARDEMNAGNITLASVCGPFYFCHCGFEDRENQISCSLGKCWRYVLWLNWACFFNCYSALVTLNSFSLILPQGTPWCVSCYQSLDIRSEAQLWLLKVHSQVENGNDRAYEVRMLC